MERTQTIEIPFSGEAEAMARMIDGAPPHSFRPRPEWGGILEAWVNDKQSGRVTILYLPSLTTPTQAREWARERLGI